MKHRITVLFLVALTGTIAWFASLGIARTKALGNGSDTTTSTIYVLITASMAFLAETLLGKQAPVQHLQAKLKLYRTRQKREQEKVTRAQQAIIAVEGQGFAYDDYAARSRAAHTIGRDHAQGENAPCLR